MKKLFILIVALIVLTTGCNQVASVSAEDIEKVTYQWEKATLQADYKREQELLYKKGTYEIHRDTPLRKNNLKYQDMKFEVYYDKENNWYYSIFTYINPAEGNKVEDAYVVRKKDDKFKIDIEESKEIDPTKIKEGFKRVH